MQISEQLKNEMRDHIAVPNHHGNASETALRLRRQQIERAKADAADYAMRRANPENAAGSLPASVGGAGLARRYAATFPALQLANDSSLKLENQINKITLTTAQQRADALRRLCESQGALVEAKSNLTLLMQQSQPANQQGSTQFFGAPASQQKSVLGLTTGVVATDATELRWRKTVNPDSSDWFGPGQMGGVLSRTSKCVCHNTGYS
jgi:hypothetical protein